MGVIIATKVLVDYKALEEITIYTGEGQIRQAQLATVASVQFLHPFSHFSMLQPHQCLLTTLVITRKSSRRY